MAFHVKFLLLAAIELAFTIFRFTNAVSVDSGSMADTLESTTGESITLICNLSNSHGINQIWFSDTTYYLSLGETIDPSSPTKANRLEVFCYEHEESCELTISNLKQSDAGTYVCGIVAPNGARLSLASADLSILVPPSDTSPVCGLYRDNAHDVVPVTSDMVGIGDQVLFSCIVTGGTPKPTVHIARDAVPVTHKVPSSFSHSYIVTEEDVGVYFTCVIEHPAIAKPRACLLLLIPGVTTTTEKPQTAHSTERSAAITSASDSPYHAYPADNRNQTLAIVPVLNMSTTMFVVILAVAGVSVLAVIVALLCCLVCHVHRRRRKRQQKEQILPHQDYELTFARDSSITPDNAAVNHADYVYIHNTGDNPNAHLLPVNPTTRGATPHPDVIPIYAKPDKVHHKHDKRQKNGGSSAKHQDGLTYADLDIPRGSHGGSTNSNIPKNQEATVYADILGTV